MALALIVLVLLGLGLLALVVHTRGRIVIVWGELRPPADDAGLPALRVGLPALPLEAPTPWEVELRRRLRQRLGTPPPAALPAPPASCLEATPVAEGRYRLLPPSRASQE